MYLYNIFLCPLILKFPWKFPTKFHVDRINGLKDNMHEQMFIFYL